MLTRSLSDIREAAQQLIKERDQRHPQHLTNPNALWRRWIDLLGFVFDFSDASLHNIRLHTGFGFFLGSNWSTVYYEANEIRSGIKSVSESKTINDYIALTKHVDTRFRCSEIDVHRELISIPFEGKYVNEDVLRAQSAISNLAALDPAKVNSYLEIGAGYGLLSNQVRRIFGPRQVVIVDHPEILFWNAVYTRINNPEARLQMVTAASEEWQSSDFVFIPPFLAQAALAGKEFDLAVNENSFCEMTGPQVEYYLGSVTSRLWYSNNRNRQFMNTELTDLTDLLARNMQLAPGIEYYRGRYQDASSPHNCKYIFFAAKDGGDLPAINPDQLCGLSVRTRH